MLFFNWWTVWNVRIHESQWLLFTLEFLRYPSVRPDCLGGRRNKKKTRKTYFNNTTRLRKSVIVSVMKLASTLSHTFQNLVSLFAMILPNRPKSVKNSPKIRFRIANCKTVCNDLLNIDMGLERIRQGERGEANFMTMSHPLFVLEPLHVVEIGFRDMIPKWKRVSWPALTIAVIKTGVVSYHFKNVYTAL